MKEFWSNQIALALILFAIIAVGALIKLDATTAKDVLMVLVAAASGLVTGQAIERTKNSRATDKWDADGIPERKNP